MSLDWLECNIDFEGQKLADFVLQTGVITFSLLGFLLGLLLQDIKVTFILFGSGILFTSIIILPSYPFYNSHPIQWLPPIKNEEEKEKE
ncbi:11625_t:CDS:2 [Entrophospora sp. SA101]|nr:10023_t:CDS:2 [Entrophospora sp. SA101]CAJ0636958.1 9607_t:CDS:2 [Entrophospora sp. SA101]CAJ0762662.1 11625_t:CDS:2 [Entrophospora sp. SA101]CAJ0839783.1 9074_t:CDS:2 [Entrophospora sp. SA101]CAJ0874536.1 17859_t:CDS:2 [Entrophospora sp. SA101]